MENDVAASTRKEPKPESILPWLWCIEYLASFLNTSVSTLQYLIDLAPEIPDTEMGKNAIEKVSLRCLEDLYGLIPLSSDDHCREKRAGFDFSLSCEHVLRTILEDEESATDSDAGGLPLSKWDILPFITHKRASLPKCALEQLKKKTFFKCPTASAESVRSLNGQRGGIQ